MFILQLLKQIFWKTEKYLIFSGFELAVKK